ncbi:Nitrogen fixation protein NifU [Mycoplasmopsis bovigenitalium 51080]|uniref:Nitrogen fixation protein NifU n=2 Tax=Mycoplasmopsis bovigenitalium TaxID=2112 RepID=N9TTX7_9BACT|nr:Nitrogen fixation protein NifU [Mycoplasmopsis bovigenitalium 51080]
MEVISLSYNQNQRREIIMSHYVNPINKKELNGEYFEKHGQACADYLKFNFSIKDDKVVDLFFEGKGCAFMIASTDIFIELVNGRKISEIIEIINVYENFLSNGGDDKIEEKLGKLSIFKNVLDHPNRFYCATMMSSALKEKIVNE